MPSGFGAVQLLPGVTSEATPTLARTNYVSSQLIRFRSGLAEKLGGWTKFYPFATGGAIKSMQAWQDLNNTGRLQVGTTTVWGVISGAAFQDITPQTLTTNPACNFTTAAGSNVVSMTDAGINTVTTFDSVYFNTPVAIDGIVLSGVYAINLVLGATSYQILAASNAIAGVAGGGAVPSFTTTNASSTVTVTLARHGLTAGTSNTNKINFPIVTAVGGITISGTYTVVSVTNANVFTIVAAAQATSGATVSMNAGNAQFVYYITLGPTATGTGYGIGGYGTGGYGTGSVSTVQTGTDLTATDWSLDNWGEIAIGNPENGGLYYWQPSGGYQNASLITTGPAFNGGCFIAMPAQILVAWGASQALGVGVAQDPLLVSWSDQLNFLQWSVTAVTQAGSYRVPTGSKIIGAMNAPNTGLIWTDIDLYSMTYNGASGLTFSFGKIGGDCGLIAKHARTVLGANVYWMNQSNFFTLGAGGPQPMPCTVWDSVFQDLDTANANKCWAWPNSPFNEVWFFYPSKSGGGGECDSYAKYNIIENAWDNGKLGRSCGIGQSVLGSPISATSAGLVYTHENGYDADGAPLSWSFTTGYFYLAEGEDYVTVDRLYPDMKWGTFAGAATAIVNLTVKVTNYSGDAPRVFGPFAVTMNTEFVPFRARGRQMAITISGSDIGSFARLGHVRYRYASDGRR